MSNLSNIIDGIGTALSNNVTGVHVYKGAPDAINEFPACVVMLDEPLDPVIAFSGNSFRLPIRIQTFISSGKDENGWAQIWDYVDPTTTNKSIIAALRADTTFGGKADDSQVVRLEHFRRSELGGGFLFAFDTILDILKTVA